jgi:hypothetical protein
MNDSKGWFLFHEEKNVSHEVESSGELLSKPMKHVGQINSLFSILKK